MSKAIIDYTKHFYKTSLVSCWIKTFKIVKHMHKNTDTHIQKASLATCFSIAYRTTWRTNSNNFLFHNSTKNAAWSDEIHTLVPFRLSNHEQPEPESNQWGTFSSRLSAGQPWTAALDQTGTFLSWEDLLQCCQSETLFRVYGFRANTPSPYIDIAKKH